MDVDDRISNAMKEYDSAQVELAKAYLAKIGEGYGNLSETKRKLVLSQLTGLVRIIDGVDEVEENSLFNPEVARKIRKELGLSQRELAGQLGTSAQNISRFEVDIIPSSKRGTYGEKYLIFLKDNGYNPLGL